MPAGDQKSTFQYLVSDTLGDSCNFDTVKTLHDNLTEMIEEHKDEPEPLRLDKTDVKKLLERSGAKEENLEQFDREFDAAAGDTPSLLASNVANTRTFEVKTPDVVIKVNPDRTDLVETKLIDGIPYLVIQLSDSVEVNGIRFPTVRPVLFLSKRIRIQTMCLSLTESSALLIPWERHFFFFYIMKCGFCFLPASICFTGCRITVFSFSGDVLLGSPR